MDPARALAPLETVVIETAFGRCGGTFARPEGEAWKSGVVVVGDADDDHLMTVCKDLASVGHAAIVLQLDLAPLTEQIVLTPSAVSRLAQCTSTVAAALEFLRSRGLRGGWPRLAGRRLPVPDRSLRKLLRRGADAPASKPAPDLR